MADEVIIGNVGGDGVASEVTLLALLAAMEKLSGKKGKGSAADKVQELHNKSIKAGTTASDKNTNAVTTSTTATKKASEATTKFANAIAGATGAALGSLWGSLKGLSGALVSGKEELGDFTQHLPLIGGYLGPLIGIVDANIASFRELSRVGATFGDGLNDIRAISARAGVPLGEFTELVSQNAERMRFFGATTASGATAFANLSKELRTGPGRTFMNLGYTAQELNESLIDYAEFNQTQIGNDRRNSKLSATSAANYLETIDQLAAVTGKRRDQIREEMNAAMADQRARLAMANMSAEEQARFSANLAAAPASLQDALKDAADGVLNNPLAQGLSVASETFRRDAANIKNMNAQEYNNFMARVSQELDAAGVAAGAGAEAIMNSGTGYGQALAMAAELRDKQLMSDQEYNDLLERRNREAARDEGIKGFSNAVRDIRTGLMDAFVSSGALKMIQDALNEAANVIGSEEFKTTLKDGVTSLISGMKTVWNFFSSIGDMFGSTGVIAAIVAGIGAMFAAKAVVSSLAKSAASAIGSAITSRVTGAMGSGGGGGGGRGGRGGARAAGNAGKGVGSFIGNVAGGAMQGAAKGLAAFANPAILVGAGILGASITAIGAGIAGAAWLLGKALPTFVDGIKSFESIDGSALIDVSVGMLALSGAMAAFGAGSAVAGLGTMVGGITGAIGKLFGADDPLEQIKKFAAANIDGAKVKNNADAMVAFSTAMAAAGGASAAEGLGSLVSGIAGGIGQLFGGKDTGDIFADMVKFASYDIDGAKVKTNAESMIAFSTAMNSASASTAMSGVSTFISGIAGALGSLFGGDSPLESLKKFGEAQINATQVITNANAMIRFAEAMASSTEATSGQEFNIPRSLVSRLEELGSINGANINATAAGLTALASSGSLKANLDAINLGLDSGKVLTYAEAIALLTEKLTTLNETLAEDNKGMFGGGTGVAAADVLGSINTSTSGSAEGMNQLNTIMQQVLTILTEMKTIDDKIEKNTKNITGNNIATGYVSNTG